MGEIFISHASADDALVREIVDHLRRDGYRSLFLDFDPEAGIAAGRPWLHELYRTLSQCRALVAVCTASWLRSQWCFAEFTYARALGKAVFVLRADDSPLPAFAADVQAVDLGGDHEAGHRALLRGLTEAGVDPVGAGATPVRGRPPYPGFNAFEAADEAVYFGREAEVAETLQNLRTAHEFGAQPGAPRILLVLGASGSGKSSLVRAGVLPVLGRDAGRWLVLPVVRPGTAPLDALAEALENAASPAAGPPSVRDQLHGGDPALARVLHQLAGGRGAERATPVLVVDQLEEVLGSRASGQAEAFLTALRDAVLARPHAPIVVATLRSDALADFQEHPLLGDLRTVDTKLAPLAPDQLAAVMVRPAERAGVQFPPELVSRVLADLETADALPILAFTLREMYDRRADRFAISERDYREVGGIRGAVEQRLGGILRFQGLTPAAEARLRDFFLTLVRVTPDGRRTRRPAAWADVPPDLRTTVAQLVDARLLVDRGAREHRTLDVVHESVFRVWPTLDRWISENEEFLAWRERLQNSVEEWKLLGRADGALLPDEALPAAEQWQATRGDALSEEQDAFVRASRARRDRLVAEETARQARELDRERALREAERLARIEAERSAALQAEAAAKLAAAADDARARLADSYWIAGVRARERESLAEAAHWFARAAAQEQDPVRRADARLAVADLTGAPRLELLTDGFEALRGLAEDESPALAPRALPVGAGNTVVSWLPGDGSLQGNGVARLWDVAGRRRIGTDMVHEDWLLGLRVSPAERTILTWGGAAVEGRPQASGLRLWSATTGEPLAARMTHGAMVTGAVFDRAESRILSHGEDGAARVWDAGTGEPICRIEHEYQVVHAAFVDGERAVLSVEANGRAWISHLSEARAGRMVAGTALPEAEWARLVPLRAWHDDTLHLRLDSPMAHPDARVFAALGGKLGDRVRRRGVLSPRGDRALTWDDGAGGWLVGVRDAVVIPLEFAAGARIENGCFSADGSRVLAWSSRDGGRAAIVRVWDAATGAEIQAALEHRAPAEPSFSPTGRWVVTWPDNSTLEISDGRTGRAAARSIAHRPALDGFEFTDDELGLLTWAGDGTARLWNVGDGSPRVKPIPHPGRLYEARLGHAATTLMTCCDDGSVRIWRLDDPRRQRLDVPGAVTSVTFARDGARALLCDVGEREQVTVRLWDLRRGEPASPPMAHDPGADSLTIVGRPTGRAVFDRAESRVLSWSKDCTARLWDLRTGAPLAPPMHHRAQLWGARFIEADSRILTWSHDGTARLWRQDGRAFGSVLKHGKSVEGAVLDAAGRRILTWSADGTARLWDAGTGEPMIPALRHDDGVTGARLSPDESKVLTWSRDGTVRLWDAANGRSLVRPMRHRERVAGACFDDAAERILSWTDFFSAWGREAGAARVWDARNGRPLVDSLQHQAGVTGAAFFAAGARILTWSKDNTARISDARSGRPVGEPLRHRGDVVGALLSRDEGLVLTWSRDRTARLWSTADGAPAALPMRHDGPITGAAFSADEERIVTWGEDHAVRLWRARDATLILHPLRLTGPVTGVRFCLDDSAVLSWSDHWATGETVLWRFDAEPTPVEDLGPLVEVATGTAMDTHGNVTFLSYPQWQDRRRLG